MGATNKTYNKEVVAHKLENAGMIPVFYHDDIEVCKQIVKACYDGGVTVFEFTNRGKNGVENFKALKTYVETNCPGMLLGIGSVMDRATTSLFLSIGADFIVSPILKEEMAEECARMNVNWIPGCGTLTEIVKGVDLGAPIVKIFPGSTLGPGFVKAVLGPVPTLKLMPTGGVKPEEANLKAWFEAGVVCVGMGSQLLTKDIIVNNDYDVLKEKVKETFHLIEQLKK